VAPYKVDMMFIHDNYDVVCSAPRIIVITPYSVVIVNEQHHFKCS